jgi:molybdopterin biosynthesis enzyme
MSALAPVCPSGPGTPSKSPIDPSAMTRSGTIGRIAGERREQRVGHGETVEIALGAPVAAAWKAGSI